MKGRVIKYVKIHTSRGYGSALHEVRSAVGDEYVLRSIETGESFSLYRAHTYEDDETRRVSREHKVAVAEAIGRNKTTTHGGQS